MTTSKTTADFAPAQFAPTQWEGADKKAAFARQFIKFVRSDFSPSQFPKKFYQRLSMTFGHVAHYDQDGFFEEFFSTTEAKVRFLWQTLRYPCYGDPAWTYSDVERVLQGWLREENILSVYEQRLANELDIDERITLARLEAKHDTGLR